MVLATGGEVGVLRLFSDPWRFSHRPVGELMKKRKLAGCSGASGEGMYFGDSCGGSPSKILPSLLSWNHMLPRAMIYGPSAFFCATWS